MHSTMVGNFHEGFIFTFFVNQKPFTKIETVKFLLFMCKVSELHFNLKLISCLNSNRSLSASVSLKPSRKLKCYVSTDARTGQWHKAKSGSNHFYEHPGCEATYLTTIEQTAEIVNNSRHLLRF